MPRITVRAPRIAVPPGRPSSLVDGARMRGKRIGDLAGAARTGYTARGTDGLPMNRYPMEAHPTGCAPAVALVNPKFPHNVGAALRACSCWGLSQLWWTGSRVSLQLGRRLPREERMKGFRAVEMIHDEDFLSRFPRGSVTPVAVELRPDAELLPDFVHPEDALYIFG